MRLRIHQSSGDNNQIGLGSEYAIARNYALPSASTSSSYPSDSQRALPTSVTEIPFSGRHYQHVQTSAGPAGYHPEAVQLAPSDFASFHRQDNVASDQHTYHNQNAVLGRQSELPSYSTSMQEQNSNLVYSPSAGHIQMMGVPPSRQHNMIPVFMNPQRPKTESKPIIDPVDNKQLCTFFLRTGTCAYGDKCRFKHPKDRPPPQLNSRGYPIRDGEPDCAHYLKRGWCAFGVTCKYNHPESTPYVPMPYQQTGFVPVPGMVTVPYIPAYSYPAFTSSGLPAPAMYAPAAYPDPHAGVVYRQAGAMNNQAVLASPDSAVDKAAQSLEALSLQGAAQK